MEQKTQTVIASLDEAVISIDRALAHPNIEMRTIFVRSAVFHWLAIMFDKGYARKVASLQTQIDVLKKQNEELQKELGKKSTKL